MTLCYGRRRTFDGLPLPRFRGPAWRGPWGRARGCSVRRGASGSGGRSVSGGRGPGPREEEGWRESPPRLELERLRPDLLLPGAVQTYTLGAPSLESASGGVRWVCWRELKQVERHLGVTVPSSRDRVGFGRKGGLGACSDRSRPSPHWGRGEEDGSRRWSWELRGMTRARGGGLWPGALGSECRPARHQAIGATGAHGPRTSGGGPDSPATRCPRPSENARKTLREAGGRGRDTGLRGRPEDGGAPGRGRRRRRSSAENATSTTTAAASRSASYSLPRLSSRSSTTFANRWCVGFERT